MTNRRLEAWSAREDIIKAFLSQALSLILFRFSEITPEA
jgi:hypothetical protein